MSMSVIQDHFSFPPLTPNDITVSLPLCYKSHTSRNCPLSTFKPAQITKYFQYIWRVKTSYFQLLVLEKPAPQTSLAHQAQEFS